MKLQRLGRDRFKVIADMTSYEGSLEQVRDFMVDDLGMKQTEFDAGLSDLYKNDNDTAIFGVNLMFIYSTRSGAVASVLAELNAIISLREEFNREYKLHSESRETRDAYNRLQNIYISFNAEAARDALEPLKKQAA